MKQKRNIYAFCMFVLLQTMIGCDHLLDVDPPANQIGSVQVFESVQTANAALAGLYSGLWENSPLSGDQTGRLLSLYTDDLDFYSLTSNNGIPELYQNIAADTNPAINSYWSNAYQKIYISNAIIEGASQSSSLNENEKSRIIAEAKLIRSILYLYLQQLFGDLPYVTTTAYTTNQSLGKTPSTELLQLLSTDLTYCITTMKDEYRNAERIFPNRKVAQLTLAKVYALQHKWQEGEALLRTIVQSPQYQFQTDVAKVFDKSGMHILWQLKPKTAGLATKEAGTYYFTNSAPTSAALSPSLVDSFLPTDKRKQLWIAAVPFNNKIWYRASKYKNISNNVSEYSIVYRLEEVYLMLAECLAQQGKVEQALPYINALKSRSMIPLLPETITGEELLSELLLEYRREFFTETGHRFFDLKRFQKLQDLVLIKSNWKEFHRLWPLPLKELLLNPNLSPQNNGY